MTDGRYIQRADVTLELKTLAGVSVSGGVSLIRDMDYPARFIGQLDQQHTNSLEPGMRYDVWFTVEVGQCTSVRRVRIYAAYRDWQ